MEVQRPCNLKRKSLTRTDSGRSAAAPPPLARPLAARSSTTSRSSSLFASSAPLCSSTPQRVERLNVSPWKPPARRQPAAAAAAASSTALRPRFAPNTERDYGWLDTRDDMWVKPAGAGAPLGGGAPGAGWSSSTLPRSLKLGEAGGRQRDYGWLDGKENATALDGAGSSSQSSAGRAPPKKKVSFKVLCARPLQHGSFCDCVIVIFPFTGYPAEIAL